MKGQAKGVRDRCVTGDRQQGWRSLLPNKQEGSPAGSTRCRSERGESGSAGLSSGASPLNCKGKRHTAREDGDRLRLQRGIQGICAALAAKQAGVAT